MFDNWPYQMDLPFLWMDGISAYFNGSENSPVLIYENYLSIYIGLVEIFCFLLKSLKDVFSR